MRCWPVLLLVGVVGCAAVPTAPAPVETPVTAPAPIAKPLHVALDGNSLSISVNGVPSYGTYLPTAVANCAIGGQTTRDMLAHAEDVDAAFDPDARNLLIAWEGTNDLYFGATPTEAVDHLLAYRQRMTDRGWTVILLSVLPRQSTPDPVTFEQQRLAVNNGLRAAGVPLIDVGADPDMGPFASVTAGVFYQPDKVHLTEVGARHIAQLVGPVLH